MQISAALYDGSSNGDHLAVIQSEHDKSRFQGAYFMNKPKPSGAVRLRLQWSTKTDYATAQEAADAIEGIFKIMPKIDRSTM